MRIVEFMILGVTLGIPSALIQLYLYKRERRLIKNSPLWSAWSDLQKELATTLHHPHPEAKELDHLLERLETFTVAGISTISPTDRRRLIQLLREKIDDPKQSKPEKLRAEFLLFAMPRAEQERKKNLAKA